MWRIFFLIAAGSFLVPIELMSYMEVDGVPEPLAARLLMYAMIFPALFYFSVKNRDVINEIVAKRDPKLIASLVFGTRKK